MTVDRRRSLVTGASGFIGRQLCRRLLDDGYQVIGAVRTPTHFAKCEGEGFLQLHIGDIARKTNWDGALQGVDVVFHLAAVGGVDKGSFDEQLRILREINVEGTRLLARECVKYGVKRIIYLSSIKAIGEQTVYGRPWTEDSSPHPVTPYGVSKWEAEKALWNEVHGNKTEAVVIRPPLVYGQQTSGNFFQLLKLVSTQIPLPFSGVMNNRSLIYIENLIDAISVCARHPDANGKTYLVSDGEDVSTGVLVKNLAELMRMKSRLFYFPAFLMRLAARLVGKSDQADRLLGGLQVCSDRICNELAWKPPFSQNEGLRITVDWYRDIILGDARRS